MNPTSVSDTIVQEIQINSPAERIFEALTNPEERVKWWGAEGRFRITHVESDLRPGGKWLMRGTGIGGKPVLVTGEYREVIRPRLLVFTWLPDWYENPIETLVQWELKEHNGITTLRVTHSGLVTEAARNGHKGWGQIVVWLKNYVEAL